MVLEIYRLDVVNQVFVKLFEFEDYGSLEFKNVLNGVGSCNLTLHLGHDLIKKYLARFSTVLVVKNNGVVVWFGFLRDFEYFISQDTEECNLFFLSWLGYLVENEETGRYTDYNKTYIDEYQEDIAWDLINYTQNQLGGWLGIDRGFYVLTKKRDRTYNRTPIGQAIINLSNVIDGFDFEFLPKTDTVNNFIGVLFDCYTVKGAIRNDLPLLSLKSNLNSLRVQTIKNIANVIYAEGYGSGDNITYTTSDINAINYYTRRESFLSFKDIRILATLQEKGETALKEGITQHYKISFNLIPKAKPDFFDFNTGDILILDTSGIPVETKKMFLKVIAMSYKEDSGGISYGIDVETVL